MEFNIIPFLFLNSFKMKCKFNTGKEKYSNVLQFEAMKIISPFFKLGCYSNPS